MLYVFAGFPRCGLNAGGLQHAVETVEELGVLEHGSVMDKKEGRYLWTPHGEERTGDIEYRLSDALIASGISWDWFPENWSFGNGATVHKTYAAPEYDRVVHGTDIKFDDFLQAGGVFRAGMGLSLKHDRHEGWLEYEARWLPEMCPQQAHVVHLTWLVSQYQLPPFAYERLREIVEEPGARLRQVDRYEERHFSETRPYDGKGHYVRAAHGY